MAGPKLLLVWSVFIGILSIFIVIANDLFPDLETILSQELFLWGLPVFIFSLCIGLVMAWSVLRTCTPQEERKPPNKRTQNINNNADQKGNNGENFQRRDTSLPVHHLDVLTSVQHSVGLIVIKTLIQDTFCSRSTGTGFVVGDGYLMTACHVITEQIEKVLEQIIYVLTVRPLAQDDFREWRTNHIDGEELDITAAIKRYYAKSKQKNLEGLIGTFRNYMQRDDYSFLNQVLFKEWYSAVTVKFMKAGQTEPRFECTFSPDIPFVDETIDVAILKIQPDDPERRLPQGLRLDEAAFGYDRVNIFGYIKTGLHTELNLDPQCEVYTRKSPPDKDVTDALKWWKEKEKLQDELDQWQYEKINFEEEYRNCVMKDGQVLLHASPKFVHGTSGSPMIVCKLIGSRLHAVVAGIYLRGFPRFYYKIKKAIENREQLGEEFHHYNKFRDLVRQNENEMENKKVIDMRFFMEGGTTMKHVADSLPVDLRNQLFPGRINDGLRAPRVVFEQNRTESALRGLSETVTAEDNMDSIEEPFGYTRSSPQPSEVATSTVIYNQAIPVVTVTEKFKKDWRELMSYLNVDNNEIQRIFQNNVKVEDSMFSCLMSWRNANSHRSTEDLQDELMRELKECGRCDIVDKLEKAIASEEP